MLTKEEARNLLINNPIEIGHWVGFKDLTEINNEWLKSFLYSTEDQTLQGHRGSYKTTTLSLFLAIHAIIAPSESTLFFRKTSDDVNEVIKQTANILSSGCMKQLTKALCNRELVLLKSTKSEIQTNIGKSVKGASQIVGLGIGTSITGKHADIVVTDDIVNVNDRISAAERERTKIAYQELQNVKNRGGRFINTGTPWHKDDAFTLMPEPMKFDCYSTGLLSSEELEAIKSSMSPSLFATNYELKHIAAEDLLFPETEEGADVGLLQNICTGHVDSAFYGEDYTAFSAMAYRDGKFYLFGKLWRKHVEDCYGDILRLYNQLGCDKLFTERNADKGMVANALKQLGIRSVTYDESFNKHVKISVFLKMIWKDLVFVEGTDRAYIEQIYDYDENADHDDAPDSAACLARLLYKKANKREYETLIKDFRL